MSDIKSKEQIADEIIQKIEKNPFEMTSSMTAIDTVLHNIEEQLKEETDDSRKIKMNEALNNIMWIKNKVAEYLNTHTGG